MKLTRDAIDQLVLPPGKTDHFIWDDDLPGFGVRLRGDTRRWVVQYRVSRQTRRESLGDVRKVKLDDARKIARQRFAQAELGVDPAAQRRQAGVRAVTLALAAERYLAAKQGVVRSSTHKAAGRYLLRDWKPLGNRPLDGVKRADVAARIQELVKLHGRTSAARARDCLSALYSWCMREGLCEANPVMATNNPTAGMPPRDRVLTDDEIRIVWDACGDDDSGRIVRLLLLTGCRREEIGGLAWSEINLDAGLMSIPGARTKNGRPLELPLPAVALAELGEGPRQDRQFVFGRNGSGFSGWSAAKLLLDSRIVLMTGKKLPPWTFHDLRRTYRTGLGRLGVPPHVAELAINHVRGGVQAIYDRHRYQPEIAQALATWADHVLALVSGKPAKLVTIRARA